MAGPEDEQDLPDFQQIAEDTIEELVGQDHAARRPGPRARPRPGVRVRGRQGRRVSPVLEARIHPEGLRDPRERRTKAAAPKKGFSEDCNLPHDSHGQPRQTS